MSKGIALNASNQRAKMSQGMKRMSENAATARNQLLNSAVDYCTDKTQRRYEKKQRLNQIAKDLKNDTASTKREEMPATQATEML